MSTTYPRPRFDHLLQLTDRRGTFENGTGRVRARGSGYTVDDAARVLVVSIREQGPDPILNALADLSIRFLDEAQGNSGGCRSRMDGFGRWVDEPTIEESWGRCVWALGTAVAHSNVARTRRAAETSFGRVVHGRSSSPRAMALAALGAAELLSFDSSHRTAGKLIDDYAASVPEPQIDGRWASPRPGINETNAIVAEAMIAAGAVLAQAELLRRGLDLLAWLIDDATSDGHVSPTSTAGRTLADVGPAFGRHPVDVAALADACARAASVDDDPIWCEGVGMAAQWFCGANDAGEPMWDPSTGGGYDGLRVDGVDSLQSAESTLAVISTLQQARRLSTALRP